jgi:hypothetical protein
VGKDVAMGTENGQARSAEEWNRIDRGEDDRDEPEHDPNDKADTSHDATVSGPGSEPPD